MAETHLKLGRNEKTSWPFSDAKWFQISTEVSKV